MGEYPVALRAFLISSHAQTLCRANLMKSFTHINKQWLVIDRLVKNWRCFVLAQKLIATVLLLSINQPLLAKP
jgi:hypothetical protein